MKDLHDRILQRMVELTGSDKLAARLKVPASTLQLWLQGKATIPQEAAVQLVDMILAADLASLIEAAKSAQPKKQLPRILVVDDDPSGAYGLARVIKQLGYPVETAADGPSALETARRFHPEVVFVDLRMPGMDGVQVADLLRAEGLTTHIIAATAYRSELERERTSAAGFAGHLLKPVDKSALENLLTKLH